MAHRHVRTRRLLEQPRLFRPRNRKDLLRYVVAKNIAPAASSERIQQPCDGDPYPSVMEELRSHFSKSGILTNIGIVDVKNHYMLYPRSQGDVINGRSQTVDNLITAATQRLSEIKEEIWVYDRGYWSKNHKLWKNVQGCKWKT
ncbi:hypothetical protein HO173_013409 [Letharia columbiana]|uniref:Uncharacterized protein n=1 Tax=Letharia columbiana TaxID=112416 RepID=A0A8H6FBY5_9LECA|nr:uncharacterized protein HO173_013409 [Letharia columbiana]KAF6222501.1 hypothetical protein HO173_013409 [Letharia columbiana]